MKKLLLVITALFFQGCSVFGIRTVEGNGFISDPTLTRNRFFNLEVPFGFRLHTPRFNNFEIGLSAAIVTAFSVSESERYAAGLAIFDPITIPSLLFRANELRRCIDLQELGRVVQVQFI